MICNFGQLKNIALTLKTAAMLFSFFNITSDFHVTPTICIPIDLVFV